MRDRILVCALLLTCSGGLAVAGDDGCPPAVNAIPLCTILSDAGKFDGKEVTVRGFYRMVLHGSILMSPDCQKFDVNMRDASDYKADRHAAAVERSLTKKNQFALIDVTIRGIFRAAQSGQCFGQNCFLYEIECKELLCARAPQDRNASLTSPASAGIQGAVVDSKTSSSGPIGTWRGQSKCLVRPSGCQDEDSVYRISAIQQSETRVTLAANKIVDGREVNMGTAECSYSPDKLIVNCPLANGSTIELRLEGNSLTGTMTLNDGTVWRQITLRRASDAGD